MPFETFKRRSRPVSTKPVISLQLRGTISLNSAAFSLLVANRAGAKADLDMFVQFVYDPENKIVGMRPVLPETPDSYPVRKMAASDTYLATGRGFLAYHQIPTETIRRYAPHVYGNIVGFSLIHDEIK
jgi:hypothetical protein